MIVDEPESEPILASKMPNEWWGSSAPGVSTIEEGLQRDRSSKDKTSSRLRNESSYNVLIHTHKAGKKLKHQGVKTFS